MSCKCFSRSYASNLIPISRENPMKLICRLEELFSSSCPANVSVRFSQTELIKREIALAGFFLLERFHCIWTHNDKILKYLQSCTDVFLNRPMIFLKSIRKKDISRPQRKRFPHSFCNWTLLFKGCYYTSLYKLFKSWLSVLLPCF